ncbi:hypothetical protein GCM10023192_01540 [Amycolatopsis samaneae]
MLKDAFGALSALKASFSAANALKASFSTPLTPRKATSNAHHPQRPVRDAGFDRDRCVSNATFGTGGDRPVPSSPHRLTCCYTDGAPATETKVSRLFVPGRARCVGEDTTPRPKTGPTGNRHE